MRVACANGWVAPLMDARSKGPAKVWVPASLDQSIAQNIRAVVLTRQGERRLNPSFGSRIHEFFFRILDSALLAELENHLMTVIAQADPRIVMKEVEITKGRCEEGEIQLRVRYEVSETRLMGEFRMSVRP